MNSDRLEVGDRVTYVPTQETGVIIELDMEIARVRFSSLEGQQATAWVPKSSLVVHYG